MITSEEYLEIAHNLEQHYSIFNKLWGLGNIVESDKIPTAAISFDNNGNIHQFLVNPKYWKTRTIEQKCFVIAHECLHILLNHGIRGLSALKNDQQIANAAMDLVVNETLCQSFGFNRQSIDPENYYMWLDKILPNESYGQSFEYYYNQLKNSQQQPELGESQLVDDHQFLDQQNDIYKILDGNIGQDEAEQLQQLVGKLAGKTPGSLQQIISIPNPPKKKKWESVIKEWATPYMKEKYKEQWIRPNRRMTMMNNDLILPTMAEDEDRKKQRIEVWFFQDTSGSCAHLAKRFFKAAKTLSPERFKIKMHCFDTRVYETSLKSGKLYGFGGTSFRCIEEYVQKHKKSRYPHAIFIITDGYGDSVSPEKPKNWHWFLSEDYTSCIPKESAIYKLEDFE